MESLAMGASALPASTTPTAIADVSSAAVRAEHANAEHECMTARELASWMRVNRKTVYEYAARNVIPCRRLGRRLVFSRAAIVAWLARGATGNANAQPSMMAR
jgi:excisionase family DNA binding protein